MCSATHQCAVFCHAPPPHCQPAHRTWDKVSHSPACVQCSSHPYQFVVSCLLDTSPASGTLICRKESLGSGRMPVAANGAPSASSRRLDLSRPDGLPKLVRFDWAASWFEPFRFQGRRGSRITSYQPVTIDQRNMSMNVKIPMSYSWSVMDMESNVYGTYCGHEYARQD